MTHSFTPKSQPSDVDIAFACLKAQGRPMYYYDLIKEVLQQKDLPLDPTHVSGILTQINLDTRFAYVGKGEWGLKVWVPTRGSKRLPTISLINKKLAYDDEEVDLEDKDTLIEEDIDELEDEVDEEVFDSEDEEAYENRPNLDNEEEPWN